jgi:hypothetical protein
VPRLKLNLWGNDGGPTALAVMPYFKVPTNADDLGNDAWEGGVILPLAVALPHGFGLGLMSEFDVLENASGRGCHVEFVNTATIGRGVWGPLGAYAEFFSAVSTDDDAPWVGTVDLGLTYDLSADVRIDAGVNIGVTDSADDVNVFLGFSFRY